MHVQRLEPRALLTADLPLINGIAPDTGASDSDGVTGSSQLSLFGSAAPRDSFIVSESLLGELGTVTANDDGDWSFDLLSLLESGEYQFSASLITQTGEVSEPSSFFSAIVDLSAPLAPVWGGIAPDTGLSSTDGITSSGEVVLSGVAEPGTEITVNESSLGVLGSVTADEDGNWSLDFTGAPLAEGNYEFTVTAKDLAGNVSETSDAKVIVIDAASPAAPVIVGVSPETGASPSDGITNSPELVINGTAEPGSRVTISEQTLGELGSVTADEEGNWSLDLTGSPLAEGSYEFIAVAEDFAGNSSNSSNSQAVIVDVTPPAAPAFIGISPDTGDSPDDGVTNSLELVINGTAEPGSQITVSEQTLGVLGVATAGLDGNWSLDLTDSPLADGSFFLTSAAKDLAGNVSELSSAITFVVDTAPPAAPMITGISPDSGTSDSDGVTNNGSFVLTGTAEPDSQVTISEQTLGVLGSVTADEDGNWSLDLTQSPFSEGIYKFIATVQDVAGNSSNSSSLKTIRVDTGSPAAPVIIGISPDFGVSNSDGVTNNGSFVLNGTAEPDSHVTISEQTLGVLGSVTADEDGNWSLDLTQSPFSEGIYKFIATVQDVAGNSSETSNRFTVILDQSMDAPRLQPIVRVDQQPNVFNFVISGSAEAGAAVTISQTGGGTVGTTVAGSDGQWSVRVNSATLIGGQFSYTAAAVDLAGNQKNAASAAEFRPNLVLINTDDMRYDALQYMPKTSALLADSGTTFTQGFTPTSSSGPSRASLMTGLFSYNNGSMYNLAPMGSTTNYDIYSTMPVWLQQAGYRTGLFGKDRTNMPTDTQFASDSVNTPLPGWSEYYAFQPVGFYNVTVNHNGVLTKYGTNPEDYSTTLASNALNAFVSDASDPTQPFFAYFSPHAPHAPGFASPGYLGAYDDLDVWRPPNFNIPAAKSDADIAYIDALRKMMLSSLLPVDDAIAQMYSILETTGQLDNTVIVFTSDNGFEFGEHGQLGKGVIYDESTRVPMVIRDGRAPVQQVDDRMVLNVDLTATLLDLGNASPTKPLDGLSLASTISDDPASWRSDFVIYNFNAPSATSSGVQSYGLRTENYKYVEYSNGFLQMYDLQNDPYELTNLAKVPGYADLRDQLAARLHQLMPADQTGPVVTNLATSIELTSAGVSVLRLNAHVSDATTGGSEVRTPEYFIDAPGPNAGGTSIDTADGRFNSPEEDATQTLSLSTLAGLSPGVHRLYVHGRDVPGNWGNFVSTEFTLTSRPTMTADSDTGDSSTDGLTINTTPTFQGQATANASISLMVTNKLTGVTVIAGTATADESGAWTITSIPLEAAPYSVVAMAVSSDGSSRTLSASKQIHILATLGSDGLLNVVGSNAADDILVDSSLPSQTVVKVNGVSVGTFVSPTKIQITGRNGNDRLQVIGSLPSSLSGGADDDTLIGGDGKDTLNGGDGNDVMIGGNESDRYIFAPLAVLSSEFQDTSDDGVFSGFTDTIIELPGGGTTDVIDMAAIKAGITADLTPGRLQLASYGSPFLPAFVKQIVVAGAADQGANFEQFLGGSGNDLLTASTSQTIKGNAGNDSLTLATRVLAGSSLAIRGLSVSGAASGETLTVQLRATFGTIQLSTSVSSGVTAGQVTGNGTSVVTITATLAAINATLASNTAVTYRAPAAGVTASDSIVLEARNAAATLIETDHLSLTIANLPSITGISGTVSYTENASPRLLAVDAVVSAPGGNLSGGTLLARFGGFSEADDRLSVLAQGIGSGQISLSGTSVLFGGIPIGTLSSGGNGGQPLLIELSAEVTLEAVQQLLRCFAYASVSENPTTTQRRIEFLLTNGAGETSTSIVRLVSVTAVNDKPVITGVTGTTTYTENATPLLLAASGIVTDVDFNLGGGSLLVRFNGFTEAEDRLWIQSQGIAAGQINVSGTSVFYGEILLGTITSTGAGGESLLIQLAVGASNDAVQQLMRSISYASVSENPAVTQRRVEFILKDGAGAAGATVARAVNLTRVNDSPLITGTGGTVSYTENASPTLLAPSAAVSDPELNLGSGSLLIRFKGFAEDDDQLSIVSLGTGNGQISVSGTSVLYGGIPLGTISSGGAGVRNLLIQLSSGATIEGVQQLLRSVAYASVSENPSTTPRQIEFVLTDGLSAASEAAAVTVSVLGSNDSPTISGVTPGLSYTENGSPIVLAALGIVADVDFNLGGGSLLVRFNGSTEAEDRLSVLSQGNGSGQISVSGTSVFYGGILLGTIEADGLGGQPLLIQLAAGAPNAAVQQLLRSVAYASVSENPASTQRQIEIVVTDGAAGESNILTGFVSVVPVNDKPTISGVSGLTSYTEGAAPRVLTLDGLVTDPEANLGGGSLLVRYNGFSEADDRLSILSQGTGSGQISVSGSSVLYGGVAIGTIALAGVGGQSLRIQLEPGVSNAAVQQLLRSITYANVSSNPSTFQRRVEFVLTDGAAAVANTVARLVTVYAVDNTKPVITGVSGAATYTENAVPRILAADGIVTDADSNLGGGSLLVRFNGFSESEDRLWIQSQGTEAGQISVDGVSVFYGGIELGTITSPGIGGQPLLIQLKAGASNSAVQQLLRSMTYVSVSENPATAQRRIEFILTDGAAAAASTVARLVNVYAVNDLPVLSGISGSVTYTENASPIELAISGVAGDVDSNLGGGTLLIRFNGFTEAEDRLAILSQGTNSGQISVNGTSVLYGGAPLGTITSTGVGGQAMSIQFAAGVSNAAVQQLLRSIVYSSVSENPSTTQRRIEFVLTDTVGAASVKITCLANVSAVNDAPMLSGLETSGAYSENAAPLILAPAGAVADPEGNFGGGSLQVRFNGYSEASDRLSILFQGTGSSQIRASGTAVFVGSVQIGTITASGSGGQPLLIQLAAGVSSANVQRLLQSIAYNSTSENPDPTPRELEFILTDSAGATNSSAALFALTVEPVNDSPVLTGISSGTATYTENAVPTVLASTIVVNDVEGNLGGGSLLVQFNGFFDADDRLLIASQGTAAGQIGVDGLSVFYGGTLIGSITSSGIGGQPLAIQLAAGVSIEAVQQLLRSTTYVSVSENPATTQRRIEFILTDASAAAGNTAARQLNVVAVNDKPVVAGVSGSTSYTENAIATVLAASGVVIDLDSNLGGGSLLVRFNGFSEADDRLSLVSQGAAAGQIAVDGTAVLYEGGTIGTITSTGVGGQSLLIQFLPGVSNAAVQQLLRSITYASVSENPATPQRRIEFVLTDSAGAAAATVARLMNVYAVNDKPVITGVTGTISYPKGASSLLLAGSGSVTDAESNLGGGSLLIRFNGFSELEDRLSIMSQGLGSGQIGLDGTTVLYGGASIGTITSGGVGGQPLSIQFAAGVASEAVQQLLRSITYASTASSPTTTQRRIEFVLTDGAGAAGLTVARQVKF
ncbi:Ig-like domain-containing protein [Planctomicrobium piriforme]|uniref:Arylsulfatase A n=1 Tax=Planctomicrobium piriforme TaxID=1576369 RepID=A0A1I3R6J2_9PLAN|nr:Ig-like domain-containing protein [Planctomicrobium piriforme]SFJ41269.1 Arylsulfatase A [Planctomicrobium piriforme]